MTAPIMMRPKITFTGALFALSFIMCIVVAFLLLYRPKANLDDVAVVRTGSSAEAQFKPMPSGAETPVPEMLPNGGVRLSASPAPSASSKASRRVDAEMDPDIRRSGGDVISDSDDNAPLSANVSPNLLKLGGQVLSSKRTDRSDESVSQRGGRSETGATPAPGASPIIIQGTPPPIAMAEGLHGTPTPVPVPTAVATLAPPRPTRMPIVTNQGAEDPPMPAIAGPRMPVVGVGPNSHINPKDNSPEAIAKRYEGWVNMPEVRSTPAAAAMTPARIRPTAELPISNSQINDLPAAPTPLATSAPAGVNVAPAAQPNTMLSNAAGPSPTPQESFGEPSATALKHAGKFTLPPAPTLPPRNSKPSEDVPSLSGAEETGHAADAEPASDGKPLLDDSDLARMKQALPPEIAQRVGRVVNPIAAQVGDIKLTDKQAEKRAEAMIALSGKPTNEDTRIALVNTAAYDWAEKMAIAVQAKGEGLSVTDEEAKTYMSNLTKKQGNGLEKALRSAGFTEEEILEEMRTSALCEKFVDAVFKKRITEQSMRATYDKNPEEFESSRKLHVMEIFKARPKDNSAVRDVQREMQKAQKQVASGANFSKVAQAVSEAPSKEQGGDLGWLDDKSVLTPQMMAALVELKPGQVSGVIESPAGFQILKLLEVQEPQKGFDAARPVIEENVRQGIRAAAFEAAQRKGTVTVDGRVLTPNERGKDGVRVRKRGSTASVASPPRRQAAAIATSTPALRHEAVSRTTMTDDGFGKPISPNNERPIAPRQVMR